MPSVSKAQNRAMHAAAAGHSTLGIPKSVGQDFAKAGIVKNAPERITHPHGNHEPVQYGEHSRNYSPADFPMTDKHHH